MMENNKNKYRKSVKSAVALILVFLMGITCLAGCGSSKKEPLSNSPTTQSQQVEQGKNNKSSSNNNKTYSNKKTDSSKASGINKGNGAKKAAGTNKAGGINKTASGSSSNSSK